MADKVIAILGGRGMLGTDLAELCRQQNYDVKIYDLPQFDITDQQQLESVVDNCDSVINCAAYTNVDGAESQAELAYKVNAEAVGRLGEIISRQNKFLLHISTDFVFDGKSDAPYTEQDQPNPISEYGRTKLEGERLLLKTGCNCCIVRVQWTYGKAGNNFVTKLLERAKTQPELKVVDDQIGSPTATTEVAKVLCELLKKMPGELFHFASSGYVSRYDMAKFVLDKKGINTPVLPCKTSDYKSPAARPLNSRFNCSKISDFLGITIENWQMPLSRFTEQLK